MTYSSSATFYLHSLLAFLWLPCIADADIIRLGISYIALLLIFELPYLKLTFVGFFQDNVLP